MIAMRMISLTIVMLRVTLSQASHKFTLTPAMHNKVTLKLAMQGRVTLALATRSALQEVAGLTSASRTRG